MDFSIGQNSCQKTSPDTSGKKNSTVVSHYVILVVESLFVYGTPFSFWAHDNVYTWHPVTQSEPKLVQPTRCLQGLQKCRVAKPPEGRNIDIYQVMLWQCLLG